MPIRHIGKSWFVDFRFGGDRCRKRSPLNSKEGAYAYELFLRKEAGVYGSIGAALRAHTPHNHFPCPTLAEFAPRWFKGYVVVNNRWAEQRHKRNTFAQHILPEFGHLRLCDIGLEEIEGYKGRKRELGLSAKTINNHLAMLHRCLTCAKEWKVLRTDVPRIPLLRSPLPSFHFLPDLDCEKLLAAATPGVPRTMILMGLRTGMRFCELAALRWQDVDLVRGSITVCRSMVDGRVAPPKNGRIRHLPLTSDLTLALSELQHVGEIVFHRGDGRMFDYNRAWKLIDHISREASIEHVSWHDLRHTFASELVERGASLLAVQRLLGHSDIQVMMRYSHLGKDSLRSAISLLGDGQRSSTSSPESSWQIPALQVQQLDIKTVVCSKERLHAAGFGTAFRP